MRIHRDFHLRNNHDSNLPFYSNWSEVGVSRHIGTGGNEFRNFLSIARSSLSELDTQLDLSQQLGFLTENYRSEVDGLLTRIDKMLYGLQEKKKREGGRA